MKLQRRERILGGVALGLVGLIGLWFLFFAGDSRSDDQLIRERDDLTAKIAKSLKRLEVAGKDATRFAEWEQRSLPADPEKAQFAVPELVGPTGRACLQCSRHQT